MCETVEPQPEAPLPAAPEPAPWGLLGAVAVTLLAYSTQIVVGFAIGALSSAVLLLIEPNLASHPEELQDLTLLVTLPPAVFASYAMMLVFIWFSVSVVCRRPFLESLHLRRPSGPGLSGATALGMSIAALSVVMAAVFPPSPDTELGGPLSRLAESGPVGFTLLVVLAVAVAPVVEEILFRGYAFLGARRTLGRFGAGAAVTVVFVALHVMQTGTYLPALAGIATMATALVILMERTGNLSYCIAGHLGYNATLALLSLLANGN